MPTITQQLLAFSKRLSKHLDAVDSSLTSLKDSVQRIENDYRAERDERKAKDSQPILVAVPPPREKEVSNPNKEKTTDEKRYRIEKWTLGVLALYTACAVLQSWYNHTSSTAAQESAKAAQLSAQLAQKAFDPIINLKTSDVEFKNGDMTFSLIVQNQGGSEANIHILYCVAGRYQFQPLTVADCPANGPLSTKNITVPPHDKIPLGLVTPEDEHTPDVRQGKSWMILPIALEYQTSDGKVRDDACLVYREDFKTFGACDDLLRPENRRVMNPPH